ncbi:MAG: cystathionine beta-lyase [Deltaproteobacteria bacterium]|nr:MAG: cystathionine beta-lyase [Deltaproteobacteria bacterium]
MPYDFDMLLDRSRTDAVKWSLLPDWDHPERTRQTDQYRADGLIPLWVADMDLPCPQAVTLALKKRAAHPAFGYTLAGESYQNSVTRWMKHRHGWSVDPGHILVSPGVVPALHLLVRAFTKPGQKVLVQQPVYYPFFSAIKTGGCEVVSNALKNAGGRYEMDLSGLEAACADPNVTLAILCNPHNPVGRVWRPGELKAFGECCAAHGVQVVSDEIHGDLILPGHTFTPFASIEKFGETCITCTAPSKTFNLAGLQTANIIIPDPDLRKRFRAELQAAGLMGINPFGKVACEAAYAEGEPWLEKLIDYLAGNFQTLKHTLTAQAPGIRITPLEGTYLVWMDFRYTGIPYERLRQLMRDKARLVMDEGHAFGPEGKGFMRMNIACPRAGVMAAAERIADALLPVASGGQGDDPPAPPDVTF